MVDGVPYPPYNVVLPGRVDKRLHPESTSSVAGSFTAHPKGTSYGRVIHLFRLDQEIP